MTELKDSRILIADLLRVIGIMMILFSHLSITIGPPWSERVQPYFGVENFYWATWGELGVTIFLVLSAIRTSGRSWPCILTTWGSIILIWKKQGN